MLKLKAASGEVSLPNATIVTDEDSVEVIIPISHTEALEDGTAALYAIGATEKGVIGFRIDFLPDWDRQVDGNLTLDWGAVRYRTLGAASDRFLTMLADAYGLPSYQRTMADIIDVTAVRIESSLQETSSPAVVKLIFGEYPEPTYAEAFVHIDQTHILFREKDKAYRAALVSAFGVNEVPNADGRHESD